MSKRKKRTRNTPSRRSPGPPSGRSDPARVTRSRFDAALLALCGFGILLTGYLTYVTWFADHPAYCSAGSGCDLVQSSRWSTLLGLPMSLWGLLTYALLARLVWRLRSKSSVWRHALLVAVCGVAISIYLTAVSVLEIEATCGYCLASFATITAILVLIALRKPPDASQFAWRRSLSVPLLGAAVLVAGLHLHYRGVFDPAAGPEEPELRALATHLAESGAKFYGAYWCPRCKEQMALFEASVDRLPYVECSPRGRKGPQAATCVLRNITDYPTWVIDGRRYSGRLSLRELTRYSRFRFEEGKSISASTEESG